MAFLDGPSPRAFAHRGWHTGDLHGLENSLAAFRRAVDEGYRYLETDVRLTADGVPVLFHDALLDRVTDAQGPIADLTFDQLSRVRIGGRAPIPTLAEVLHALPDARFNIEPKTDAAVGPLLDLLHDAGAAARVCVGAFSDRRLQTVRAVGGPGLATSLGPREISTAMLAAATGRPIRPRPAIAAQVPPRFGRLPVATPRFLRAVQAAGLEVHVWTVNDPAQMNRLLDLGVDGIMTDRPDLLREVLRRRGQWA